MPLRSGRRARTPVRAHQGRPRGARSAARTKPRRSPPGRSTRSGRAPARRSRPAAPRPRTSPRPPGRPALPQGPRRAHQGAALRRGEAQEHQGPLVDDQGTAREGGRPLTATGHRTSASKTARTSSDVPARLDRLPWARWHWLVLAGLGTVWILDGLEVTIVGAVGSTLTKAHSGISISTAQIGDAAGVYVAGACLGALVFGYLTDKLGRKKLFLVTLGRLPGRDGRSPAFSTNAWIFFAFRFFTGIGIGGEYAAINSAIDELIPARVRGRSTSRSTAPTGWAGGRRGGDAGPARSDLLPVNVGWRVCFLLARCSVSPSSSSVARSPRARAG